MKYSRLILIVIGLQISATFQALSQENYLPAEFILVGIKEIENPVVLLYTDTQSKKQLGSFIISESLIKSLGECPKIEEIAELTEFSFISGVCQFMYVSSWGSNKVIDEHSYLNLLKKECELQINKRPDQIPNILLHKLCPSISYWRVDADRFLLALISKNAYRKMQIGDDWVNLGYFNYYVPLLIPLRNN